MSEGRSSWEPRRWSEPDSDGPAALQLGLQDARVLQPEAAQVARLAERLGVGSGGVVVGAGLASTAPVSGVVAYKLWAYLSGVVAVSSVAFVMLNEFPTLESIHVTNADAREPVTQPVAETGAQAVLAEVIDTPQTPRVEVTEETSPLAVERTIAPRGSTRRRGVTSVSVAAAPPASAVGNGKLNPQGELAILNGAQDALAQAPRRALSLVQDHARDYPSGVFAQEREVIAIEALIKLQRSDAAAARGRAFLNVFPTSTHASRVRQMLGE